MFVEKIHEDIKFLAKKYANLYLSSSDIDTAWNKASYSHFKKLYGLPEMYQPGMPIPSVSFEVTQKIKDALRVFKKQSTIVPVLGKITLPSDYVHLSKITYKKPNNGGVCEVKVIDDAHWDKRINRITAAPSKDYPVCNIQNTFIEFRPSTLESIELTYLKLPNKIVWSGMDNGAGGFVFDGSNSTDTDWPEVEHEDIMAKALNIIGVVIEDDQLAGYAQDRKVKGE